MSLESADLSTGPRAALADRVPPHVFFVVSAVFHYLGPACAVLLFVRVAPLGVAWLRIATAAAIFAAWRRPWRTFRTLGRAAKRDVIGLGVVLALMNASFYLAIDRLPLATVGAIEFLGPVGLAVLGLRSARNRAAFALTAAGVALLTRVHLVEAPLGYLFAFANCGLFVLYVVLGHRLAGEGGAKGVDRLAAAMLVAMAAAVPIGLGDALPAVLDPVAILAAIGVGIASSVVPYVCDQLAMARLPRASFALLLALLPGTASLIGIVMLGQVPSPAELAGIGLVIAGVAIHRDGK